MTTYNTGNPIGSTAVKDLYDNAENLDVLVNDKTKETHPDRLGVPRKTWHGMEQDFQQFLIDSGYKDIGDYVSGLVITARNQIFWRDGELYRAGAGLELPYTTTGVWTNESELFVPVGDAVLRQELSNPDKGSAMVARGVVSVDSITDLLALPEGQRKEDLRYLVKGYHAGSTMGGGEFYYKELAVDTPDNGMVFEAPSGGRFFRLTGHEENTYYAFGATGDGSDQTDAITKAHAALRTVRQSDGTFGISEEVALPLDMEVSFSPAVRIINLIEDARGTGKALFAARGSEAALTSLSSTGSRGSKDINVVDASGFNVGDVISIVDASGYPQTRGKVAAVTGNTITLDRGLATACASGGAVNKVLNPVSGVFDAGGAEFDFNGTVDDPRYGFGVIFSVAVGAVIKNIRAINIGSKVVEIARGIDCSVENISCFGGTDPLGTGGHSYVVRLSTSSWCRANKISGINGLRHVVDLASASSCVVSDCSGVDNIQVDFLTHFNHSVGNTFRDCYSENNTMSAFAFTPSGGDVDNKVFNAHVVNGALSRIQGDDAGGNEFIGGLVDSPDLNSPVVTFHATIRDMTIICQRLCDYRPGFEGVLKVFGGSVHAKLRIADLGGGVRNRIYMYGVTVEFLSGNRLFNYTSATTDNTEVQLVGGRIIYHSTTTSNNNCIFYRGRVIKVTGTELQPASGDAKLTTLIMQDKNIAVTTYAQVFDVNLRGDIHLSRQTGSGSGTLDLTYDSASFAYAAGDPQTDIHNKVIARILS